MIVRFADKALDCRHLSLATGKLKLNDIVLYNGSKYVVETVQRDCYSWEGKYFTNVLMRDETGARTDIRYGVVEVYRPRKAA